MDKVYCKDCEYYKLGEIGEVCCAPENLIDTHYSKNGHHVRKPGEINKSNSCIWYKEEPDYNALYFWKSLKLIDKLVFVATGIVIILILYWYY